MANASLFSLCLPLFALATACAADYDKGLPAATLDPGGMTFDLEAISRRRFPAVAPEDNLVKGTTAGGIGFTAEVPLPDDRGGRYALSMRLKSTQSPDYRHEVHSNGGFLIGFAGASEKVSLNLLTTSGDWMPWRGEFDAPKGATALKFSIRLKEGATFAFEDLAIVRLPDPPPLRMKLATMHEFGNTFAVSRGQVAALMFYFNKRADAKLDEDRYAVEVTLPKGLEFVDTSFGDLATKKTEMSADGATVTTFRWKGLRLYSTGGFCTWGTRGILVRAAADAAEGPSGVGSVRVTCGGRDVCAIPRIDFSVVPPIAPVRAAKRYFNGVDYGAASYYREMNGDAARAAHFRFMADCGVRGLIANGDTPACRRLARANGIPHVFANSDSCANGYDFNWNQEIPEDVRFVHNRGENCDFEKRAICPIAVYSDSEWLKSVWVPKMRRELEGASGLWANWEPCHFNDAGCYCDRCREAFRAFSGMSEESLAKDWPKGTVPQGFVKKHRKAWSDFRTREHARIIRLVDRYVTEMTGGAESFGFIPGVEWADMSSCRQDEDLAAQYRPFAYADELKWIEPWGPYAAWEAEKPYAYRKNKPLAPFFAAADLRREFDKACAKGRCPNLMAYPQGFQCGSWVTVPEALALALDSYFFNRWQATMGYLFPRGCDARFWRRYAEASARAGRYEDFVWDGQDVTADVEATPVSEFATPVSYATRYLPESRNAALLQLKAFAHKGRRIVAALNFWQKGEAFFDLRAHGLDGRFRVVDEDGILYAKDAETSLWSAAELEKGIRLHVGAMRTKVFELVPEGADVAPRSVLTRAALDRAYEVRRPALKAAADEDARHEKANPTVPRDWMPMI